MAPVTQPCGAVLVVSLGDGAHPVGRVAGNGSHLRRGQALGEPPDHLPVAARDGVSGGALPLFQFRKRKVGLYRKSFRHIPIIHPDLVLDVSEIAKQFGGGGHKHAAGFKLPWTAYRNII